MAPTLKTIVVDNASSDETREVLHSLLTGGNGLRVLENSTNIGFAAAVNQGVRSTDAEFILLLNPDVNLLSAVDRLEAASLRHGLSAGRLVGLDGRTQAGFTIRRFPTPAALCLEAFGINRLWPSNPVNRRYRYLGKDLTEAGEVEQPAGAFLMFRRDVWEKIGGLDEDFRPIWFEDVDFCRRAVAAGLTIQYEPSVFASHAGAHSINQIGEGCRARYWCVSLLMYAAKHFRSFGYRGVCAAVLFSSIPRMVARMMRERSLAPVPVYLKIAWFAGLCLVSSRGRGVGRFATS